MEIPSDLPQAKPHKICSGLHMVVGRLIYAVVVISFLLGMGLAGWGAEKLLFGFEDQTASSDGLAVSLLVAGVCLLALACFCIWKPYFFVNVWFWHVARVEVKKRLDRIVDPDSPKSYFVALVPRESLDDPSVFNAKDLGFLIIDSESRNIRFEGDARRYSIPVQNVLESKQETSFKFNSAPIHGGVSHIRRTQQFFFIVIEAVLPGGTVELIFRILAGRHFFSESAQGAANLTLLTQLHQLKRGLA